MDKIETIPMVRAEPIHPGGPVTADVHPKEVPAWGLLGWRRAPPEPNTTTTEAGDSAPDGGQEGTAPADEGADASAPMPSNTTTVESESGQPKGTGEADTGADTSAPESESTVGMAGPAQDAGGETGAVPDAPATSEKKPRVKKP